jgi:stage V sporulation protein AA
MKVMSTSKTIYIKAEQNVELQSPDVYVKDIGKLTCSDDAILAKAKAIKLHHFKDGEEKRQVLSILKVIEEIEKACPNVSVECIGETDVLLEYIDVDKHKGFVQWVKLAFVALISFFGTAFTIMAFHNDIGINAVFEKVYEMVMGQPADGYSILELSYSIGLAVGIIVFFNHIGGRRITKDPTPIEVEMRTYERDVNTALIETAGREGKVKDVC